MKDKETAKLTSRLLTVAAVAAAGAAVATGTADRRSGTGSKVPWLARFTCCEMTCFTCRRFWRRFTAGEPPTSPGDAAPKGPPDRRSLLGKLRSSVAERCINKVNYKCGRAGTSIKSSNSHPDQHVIGIPTREPHDWFCLPVFIWNHAANAHVV